VRKQLEAALPEAQVMGLPRGQSVVERGLDHSTAILSLICLVAMCWGHWRGYGHACPSGTAHGYAGNSQGFGSGIG